MKLRTLILYACSIFMCTTVQPSHENMPRLLIKIPTRSRPERLFKMLDVYYSKLSQTIPYTILVSCDIDDATMNTKAVIEKLQSYPHLYYYFGNSKTKVEAYNADMDKHQTDWDIVLVSSDDMEPIVQNFDLIIAQNMTKYFPDYDGVLNFNDGNVGPELNTYPIIGKKYYDRFGYIYAPCYKSLACDNELTSISKMLRREKCFKQCIIKHNNPIWLLNPQDALFQKNEMIGHKYDIDTYKNDRRPYNFYLDQQELDKAMPKMWSILICTLDEREQSFNFIYNKLQKQIADLGLDDQVEIIYFKDNRENSVGFKRNWLLEQSRGKYICYVDDDDDVSDDYIKIIYEKLLDDPDCVSLKGIVTFDGKSSKIFVHSLQYDTYFEKDGIYYRPPNHLNPMKRIYGCQFVFPEINYREDTNWAMQVTKTGLLKKEAQIDKPYYFYHCVNKRKLLLKIVTGIMLLILAAGFYRIARPKIKKGI